ncbi:MMPL family transporter [Halomonas sp. NO4]|uniref:MMPL family transporter n=1 Tax=Halomonas sp. NO4 TaxID=2484813 RepID=UPI0013D7B909|nr:MMPL family transporter [Halomonas sp. NO4]
MKDRRARVAALAWGLALVACALLLSAQLLRDAPLDTRLTALLPETPRTALLERAEENLDSTVESQVLLLLSGPDAVASLTDLKQRLQASGSIAAFASDNPPRPDQTLAPYRYRLLAAPMVEATAEAWQARGLSRLFTPGIDAELRDDPFGLLDAWIAHRFAGPVTWRDGMPVVSRDGQRWVLMSATLAGSPYDMARQRPLVKAIADFEQAHPELEVLRAGLVFHAAAGTRQAKREITTIGLGSLVGILFLLAWVFRRPAVLASLLLPVAAGVLFALPLTWTLFGTLNLLTLAFGASLIGLAVDYALHLQCARALHPCYALSRLWPGLALGLISSLTAYLIQLATPLPGLRQMATFTALGLLGAWLTVRLWLPLLPLSPHPATLAVAERLNHIRLQSKAAGPWLVLTALGLIALGLALTTLSAEDDLRQLNPSPPDLVREQQQVQALLERTTGQHYLVVTDTTEERLLERLEGLDAPLSRLVSDGHLSSYHHLAQAVPSAATQNRNLARVRQRYTEALPGLLDAAQLPSNLSETLQAPLISPPMLTPETWLKSLAGNADRALWLGDANVPAALVQLEGVDASAQRALTQLAAGSSELHYRDRVGELTAQLAQLREQITRWLGLALLALIGLFGWRYRRRAWRVLLPPVGAVLLTLGLFAVLGIGVTLFHVLGLLLVLGIGLDAGIFSTEHPEDPAAWLAISLSCASSLLAFGLLALSATPALHQLGLTCLAGLVATWALVPFARATGSPDTYQKEQASHGEV